MAFRVPENQAEYIREFLKLPDEKVEGFLAALEKAEPQFNYYELSQQMYSAESLTWDLTLGIVSVLVSLYRTGDREKVPIEKFLDEDVHPSLTRADVFSPESSDDEWKKLRKFFLSALSHERSVGTAAKAGPVLTEHERIFNNARIMTDLRPIYHFNISDKPDAALIIHTLKISQRDPHGNNSDLFFALDSNDLATMKQVIERAVEKEETLKDVMKNSGVAILDVKAFY
jgi:hypothetical protein